MNLNHTQKVILGIFTFLPFVLFPLLLWQLFQSLGSVIFFHETEPDPSEIVMPIVSFVFPIILLTVSAMALMIFYVIHVVMNKSIEASEQILWILLFIFFGVLVFPAYWLIRIWNKPNKA